MNLKRDEIAESSRILLYYKRYRLFVDTLEAAWSCCSSITPSNKYTDGKHWSIDGLLKQILKYKLQQYFNKLSTYWSYLWGIYALSHCIEWVALSFKEHAKV